MIRKLAILATVALVPSLAFAAGGSTNTPASIDTHVVGADTKVDSTVKADAGVKPAKAAVKHKVKSSKADTKAPAKTDGKVETKSETTKL
jgi:hypothetical protein